MQSPLPWPSTFSPEINPSDNPPDNHILFFVFVLPLHMHPRFEYYLNVTTPFGFSFSLFFILVLSFFYLTLYFWDFIHITVCSCALPLLSSTNSIEWICHNMDFYFTKDGLGVVVLEPITDHAAMNILKCLSCLQCACTSFSKAYT